jgi:glycosyltransferase involved in cell wall biosynthesis
VVAVGGAVSARDGGRATRCLVLAPYSFSGRGPADSCARIAAGMVAAGLATTVCAGRVRVPLPDGVEASAPLAAVVRRLRWSDVERPVLRLWERRCRAELRSADPATTIVHVWPGTPIAVVREAQRRGFVTVREMINSALATSGPILDAAYAAAGLPPSHGVTASAIADETAELALYDYVFASNPEVERSLRALGIPDGRVLATTFGWSPARFGVAAATSPDTRGGGSFRAVFVGRVGVRKGVPELLEAWGRAAVPGELVLVGPVDAEVRPLVEAAVATGSVRALGQLDDLAAVLAESDVFVFPTHEEGGPQVTYEAAACGLPVVTTPMGAARLVQDGRNGLVVPAGSADRLAAAIRTAALDPERRRLWAARSREAAAAFTYDAVGARRAALLRSVPLPRAARPSHADCDAGS